MGVDLIPWSASGPVAAERVRLLSSPALRSALDEHAAMCSTCREHNSKLMTMSLTLPDFLSLEQWRALSHLWQLARWASTVAQEAGVVIDFAPRRA